MNTTTEKFENAAFLLWVGPRAHFENLKTPALCFTVDENKIGVGRDSRIQFCAKVLSLKTYTTVKQTRRLYKIFVLDSYQSSREIN